MAPWRSVALALRRVGGALIGIVSSFLPWQACALKNDGTEPGNASRSVFVARDGLVMDRVCMRLKEKDARIEAWSNLGSLAWYDGATQKEPAMSEFIMENRSMSRYFKFNEDNTSATLVSMADATGFGSEMMGREALVKAASSMALSRKDPPKWVLASKDHTQASLPKRLFSACKRPTLSDLVGVFDAFYVRSSEGWLSRPHTRSADRLLLWNDSFAYAVPFADLKAAKEALSLHGRGGHGPSIIKSSNVFTEVVVDPAEAKTADHVRSAIQSACSARDIVKELELAASERMRAMSPPDAEPDKKRAPRL